MSDHLTQLQDSLREMATMIFASVNYVNTHYTSAEIPGQPYHGPYGEPGSAYTANPGQSNHEGAGASVSQQQSQAADAPPAGSEHDPEHRPLSPESRRRAFEQMARDLVKKQKDIEALIDTIPGAERTDEQQNEIIEDLEKQLVKANEKSKEARDLKEQLIEKVEDVMMGLHTVG